MQLHTIDRQHPLNDVAVHQGRVEPTAEFLTDDAGNPTGGMSHGEGFHIAWQNGVQEPNGAIIEDILAVCKDRLEYFQRSRFACTENDQAITYISDALSRLYSRTARRKDAGTEGTYTGN